MQNDILGVDGTAAASCLPAGRFSLPFSAAGVCSKKVLKN